MKLRLRHWYYLVALALPSFTSCATKDKAIDPVTSAVKLKAKGSSDTDPEGPAISMLPTAPRLVSVLATGPGEVKLAWASAESTHSGFIIERSEDETTWKAINTAIATDATYSDTADLAAATRYSYHVIAFNAEGNSKPSEAKAVETPELKLLCPSGFVKIPGNAAVDAKDPFCVMKYEAKIKDKPNGNQVYNAVDVPEAVPASTPWVNINRSQAESRCQALGPNYDLTSNAQWQAIARNIEAVSENWSGNKIGTGSLSNGYSRLNPPAILAANDGSNPCFGTGRDNCTVKTSTDFSQKRTFLLSTGETVWDLAGNAFEWVKDDNNENLGANIFVALLMAPTYNLAKWGPAGKYEPKNSENFGLGFSYFNDATKGTVGALLRGGGASEPTGTGIFTVVRQFAATTAANGIGFRCVLKAEKQP